MRLFVTLFRYDAQFHRAVLSACMALSVTTAPVRAAPGAPVDLAHSVVPLVIAKVDAGYPYPEIAHRYKDRLQKSLASGQYAGLTGKALAKALNADIQAVHKDVHLGVYSSHDLFVQATAETGGPATPEETAREQAEKHAANFGFTSVDVDAQTGTTYIRSAGPWWADQQSFEMAAGALALASQSRNVIIDVRGNPGGSGLIGRFLASYFFDVGDEKFYLDGFGRTSDQNQQEWTYGFVPGHRMPKASLYILIDKHTGSAAEGFAFAMQKMHRATIVGEPSTGGGIAGSLVPLADDLVVFLPVKMVVAPGSRTGWEGTGVIPDVSASGKDARAVALDLIRSKPAAS